jgi:hypothetical protein
MPPAFELAVQPADRHVRDVVVHVLVGVPHVAAVEHQRLIQQRAVAVLLRREPVHQVRHHLDVILIDLRQLGDAARILAVM